MFLESLTRRNPDFVAAAVSLHQEGQIPANSYVLDLDAIQANTKLLCDRAHGIGLTVWAMTKQLGRVPPALNAMSRGGVDGFVAVDMACARPIAQNGHRVGHIGHLVQIPRADASEAAAMRPDYWTVFSDDKAAEAADAATHAGTTQRLLVRIHDPDDIFYPGHEGGFPADQVTAAAERIDALDHVDFAGVTTFPALLFDQASSQVVPTPNLATLERAAADLRDAGRGEVQINAPGTTSTEVLTILADAGATQVEPGHGLTGTTPLHAVADLPESPAALYLTEISHHYGDRAYCFGGGLYIDRVFPSYQVTAVVGGSADEALNRAPVPAYLPSPEAIDYYGQLDAPEGRSPQTGDSVVFGFRMQAFYTRAHIVPISGVKVGNPTVEGLWAPNGTPVDWGGAGS